MKGEDPERIEAVGGLKQDKGSYCLMLESVQSGVLICPEGSWSIL